MFKIIQKFPIKIIVLFSLLFRLLFYFLNQNVNLSPDSQTYIDLAKIISTGSINGYFGGRSLGYPLIIFFMGNSLNMVVIFQIILGVFSTILWYKILQHFHFKKHFSVLIVLFFNSYFNVLFFEHSILIETVTLFFVSLLLLFIIQKNSIKTSLCITFLVLLKPFYIYLAVIVFIYLCFSNLNWNTIKNNVLVLFLPFFVFLSWSYVNFLNTGYFVSSTYFGLNKIQNCVNFIDKAPPEFNWIKKPYLAQRNVHSENGNGHPMCIWYAVDNGDFNYTKLTFPQLSNEFGKCADSTIKNNFGLFLKQVIFLSFKEFWNVENNFNFIPNKYTFFKYFWNFQRIFLRIIKILFLFLIPFYCFTFFKNKKFTFELFLICIVLAAGILQAIVTYGSNGRYSFPFEFIMITLVFKFINNNYLFYKK